MTKAVAKASKSEVANVDAMDFLKQHAGEGTEDASRGDFQIPMIYIAQSNSPCVDEDDDSYITGCKIGHMWDTVNRACFEEARFIPCHFTVKVLEWVPRDSGGGLVEIHPNRDILHQTGTSRGEKGSYMLGENELVETAEWTGYIEINGSWQQVVVPMSSSNLKCSRLLNTMIAEYRPDWWDVEGASPPAYARTYTLATEKRENADGKWRAFVVSPGDPTEPSKLSQCLSLYELAHSDNLTAIREQEVSPSGTEPEVQGSDEAIL